MKRSIFIIICTLFACLNTTMAQVKISCMDLNLTKWKVVEDYTDEWGIHYTGSPKGEFYQYTTKEKIWHQKDGRTATYQYYITDEIPTEFEFNKVGSKTKGRYYIEYNSVLKTFECWKIKEFDKNAKVMTHGYIESGINLALFSVHYQLTEENSPTTNHSTYDTPMDPIVSKEYDVLKRDTSTGNNSSTGGSSPTGKSASTSKSTSTSGKTTTKNQTDKYVDPKEQLTPLR